MDGTSIRRDPLRAAGTTVSARDLAFALVDAGHRRLAVVTGNGIPDDSPFAQLCTELSLSRLPAVRRIAVADGPDGLDRAFFTVFRGTHYPTGLVCSDSSLATAAVRSLRELGFRVPGEMMVVWPAATVPA
jgi:DNA-binding LacI/PurR family transcriptional regulator